MPTGGVAVIIAQNAYISQQLEKTRCEEVVQIFDSKNCTIGEALDYAHCINLVYPQPLADSMILVLKGAFVLALIGMVLGILYAKNEHEDIDGYFMLALFGFFVSPFAAAAIVGLIASIQWLFFLIIKNG